MTNTIGNLCAYCDFVNPSGNRFCGNCGSSLSVACSSCAATTPAGRHFCDSCGVPLVGSCPRCSATNRTDQRFCGQCGGHLVVATPVLVPGGSTVAIAVPIQRGSGNAASSGDTVLEERRLITALFCDLVGFTPLTESLDPEEVRQIQAMYFGQMSEQLYRFGGSVEKYAGDAVLALFGNPIAHEDDPERAVRCALAMQDAFKSVADMARMEYGKEIALRIGVNTGEVVSGAWNVDGKLDYSATGDALNTAARLQTACDPGGVIVGPETMHLARRAIRFGPRRDLTLKGKSELFPAYPVLGLREEIAERWETNEQLTPLVGRERELVFLLDRWARAQTGEGRLLTLIAEAGAGKSRLLTHAVERMTRVAGTVVIRGRCLSYGEGLPLHLVADLLRSVCQVREGTPAEDVRQGVRMTVDALLAPWDEETRDAAADVLGGVLGLPPGPSSVTHASPLVRRQTLVRSLQLVLSALSTHSPAIVVLEDLHWIDRASAEVLEAVLPALRECRALVVMARRVGGALTWETWPEHEALPVEPLTADDALMLARAVLGGAELDPALERQVADRTSGNPFFVEELLRSMQELGALEEHDGRLRLIAGAAEKLPTTLTELLMARLDQLDPTARSTAQFGSVIGRTFAVPLLARLAERDAEKLQIPLNTLEAMEIAFPRGNDAQEYVFKHATIREVAYNALLHHRRRTLHAATARAIIDMYPADDQVDVIAYHFALTREHIEAAFWLERSADRAASVFANEDAIERYREARRRQQMIEARCSDQARVDEKLGRILRVAARYDEALETLTAALAAFQEVADAESQRRVTAEIGRVHRARATAEEGIARIRAFLEAQPNDVPATSGLAALHVVLARLYFSVGKYEEVFEASTRGSEIAQLVEDKRVLAEAEMARANSLYYLRRIDEALEIMEATIPLAEQVGDFEVLSILLGNASVIYRDAGELQRSLELQERSLHLTERTGDFANHAFALTCMGEITWQLGDWEGARGYLERSRAAIRSAGNSWFASYPLLQLGRVEVSRGAFESAAAYLEESLSIARSGEDSQPLILGACFLAEMDLLRGQPEAALTRLLAVLDGEDVDQSHGTVTLAMCFAAWAHLACGNLDEAERLAQLSIQRFTEENAIVDLLMAKRVAGMVAAARRDYERARATFEEIVAAAREVRVPYAEACALLELGAIELARDEQARNGRLNDALQIFNRLGAQPYIDRTMAALAAVTV